MKVKTPIIVLAGFISLATISNAAATKQTAQPLKQRVLSETLSAGKQGSNKHIASQVSSNSASQSGIMNKATMKKSAKTLVQQDGQEVEQATQEPVVQESTAQLENPSISAESPSAPSQSTTAEDTTTVNAPIEEAPQIAITDGNTGTEAVVNNENIQSERIRNALNPHGDGYDPPQLSIQGGKKVLDFGNNIGSRNEDRGRSKHRSDSSRSSDRSNSSRSRSFSTTSFGNDASRYNNLRSQNLRGSWGRGGRDSVDRDDRGLGVGRVRGGCSTCGDENFGNPSVGRVRAPGVGSPTQLGGTTIPSADVQIESNRALGFHLQPDVQLNRAEESAMFSNEETHREGCTSGSKFRHFNIKGDIVVSESVTFNENSIEEEQTAGRASKNTVAVETTDVGDVLSGNQQVYNVETRQPLEYTLGRRRRNGNGGNLGGGNDHDDDDCNGLGNPFPETCTRDRDCKNIDPNYVCSSREECGVEDRFRGGHSQRVCVPIRGNECSRKDGKYCEIEGVRGKCSDRNYCVPLVCRDDDECLHDDLYFCKRSRNLARNGRKGQCFLRSEL